MATVNTVWVLTFETNDYDQHGEYFVAVFAEKPSTEKLAKALTGVADVALLEHIRAGGGRRAVEYIWYNLAEEPLL